MASVVSSASLMSKQCLNKPSSSVTPMNPRASGVHSLQALSGWVNITSVIRSICASAFRRSYQAHVTSIANECVNDLYLIDFVYRSPTKVSFIERFTCNAIVKLKDCLVCFDSMHVASPITPNLNFFNLEPTGYIRTVAVSAMQRSAVYCTILCVYPGFHNQIAQQLGNLCLLRSACFILTHCQSLNAQQNSYSLSQPLTLCSARSLPHTLGLCQHSVSLPRSLTQVPRTSTRCT